MNDDWATPGLRTKISEVEAALMIRAYRESPDQVVDPEEGTTISDVVNDLLDEADWWDSRGYDWRALKVALPPTVAGEWTITNHAIGRDSDGRLTYLFTQGLDRDCGYDEDGTVTTMLSRDGQLWMSDTKAEIIEHLPFIDMVTAMQPQRVLVTGLGIGMITKWLLSKPYIESVVVVELDQSLIDLMSPLLADPKLMIVQGDALSWTPPDGVTFDVAWHDIWPTISSDNVAEMDSMKDRYAPYVTGYQLCWQEDGCRAILKNEEEFTEALAAGDWTRVKELDPDF